MAKMPVTSAPSPFDRILTGEFHCRRGFITHRPQGTADWLIIQTIGGAGALMVEGQWCDVIPGDIILSRPHSAHLYQTSPSMGKWDLLWAHFHPRNEWLDWLRWPSLGGGWGRLRCKGALEIKMQNRLRQMHNYASQSQGLGRQALLAMNALEEVLLWCDAENESRQRPVDQSTQAVLDAISSRYHERLTLSSLAKLSGQSVARLTRQFRKYVGSSPQQVLEERRLDRARQLLARTTLSIKEISVQTGFASPFYFSNRFKMASGSSPRRYREKMSLEETLVA